MNNTSIGRNQASSLAVQGATVDFPDNYIDSADKALASIRTNNPAALPLDVGDSAALAGILSRLKGVENRGNGQYQAKCPAHDDQKASLSIGVGEGGKILIHCHAGCDPDKVLEALGVKWDSLSQGSRKSESQRKIEQIYDYVDANGELVHQTVRYRPKGFSQRRPDGKGGWIWNLKGLQPVIYHLPEVLKAETVYIPEGEKDCDSLAAIDLTATTNPMGAKKWRSEHSKWLKDKNVVVLPDHDGPGRVHGLNVAQSAFWGQAASVKIVELPDLPPGGKDISDWLKAGGTKEKLLALVAECPEFRPDASWVPVGSADEMPQETQAETLVRLAGKAVLFHSPDDGRYACVPQGGHHEVRSISSKEFREWLTSQYYAKEGKPPSNQALQAALSHLAAKARIEGEEHPVYVRVGEHGGNIYVDLCNPAWEVVEITPAGWRTVSDPPIRFRRSRAMMPLPNPVRGGSLEELKPFLNIPDGEPFRLVCGFLVYTICPWGPYPILNLEGEQGTAKSTTARILRSLIDPSKAMLRATPRDERDLMIAANNSWLPAFDNLSGVQGWLSDALCRLSTGGGFSTRELYSDSEETIFEAARPIILTGIDQIATRHDLIDRSIIITLPVIPENRRRQERKLRGEFEAVEPRILGALFDAASMALANIKNIHPNDLPRMADFAAWVIAAEPALPWQPGEFIEAFRANRADAISLALDADVVADAVKKLMENRNEWTGTPSALLEALNGLVPETTRKLKAWPKAANILTARLRRMSSFQRATGIALDLDGKEADSKRSRRVAIRKGTQNIVQSVQTVPEGQIRLSEQHLSNRTIKATADDAQAVPSEQKPASGLDSDDSDDPDDRKPGPSSQERTQGSILDGSMGAEIASGVNLSSSKDDPACWKRLAETQVNSDEALEGEEDIFIHVCADIRRAATEQQLRAALDARRRVLSDDLPPAAMQVLNELAATKGREYANHH